jgi:hypothetical protein
MQQLAQQDADLSIDECARQALVGYPDPDPPPERPPTPETPLQVKFRHFSRTLLGTSPDIEAFNERASFLYSPDFLEYYTRAAKQEPDTDRIVANAGRSVDIGIEGLTDFCSQHPEAHKEAVEYMAIAFAVDQQSGFVSGTSALANIANTESTHFQEHWTGGYFHDIPHTPKQLMAAECLAELDFGDVPRAIGATAIHHAAFGPLTIEKMYQLRNFNRWLAEEFEARQRGEPRRPEGYERRAEQLFSDAYEVLRNITKHVAELGSIPAERILAGIPEIRRGQTPERTQLIALANVLVPKMNEAYFENKFILRRLDPRSDEALPQAFDRLLYVLTKELPTYGVEEVDNKHREIISLAGESISSLVALGYLRLRANSPVTVGDIVALFPNADPETLATIVEGARERFARSRGRNYSIYFDYKRYSRRGGALHAPNEPGRGFMS